MKEQIRTAHTNYEAVEIARRWMIENYGIPKDMEPETRNRFHEKLGMLVDFIGTLCPKDLTR